MQRKTYETLFLASTIILVGLVASINCLQGTPFVGWYGGTALKCPYSLTSGDIIVKVGTGAIFALFLGLLFGPIVAAILHPLRTNKATTS